MKFDIGNFGLGLLVGMVLNNIMWYIRFSRPKFLEELIFYSSKGDISLFLNMAIFTLYGLIFYLAYLIYLDYKKKSAVSTGETNGKN